jgi:hypothetical protein
MSESKLKVNDSEDDSHKINTRDDILKSFGFDNDLDEKKQKDLPEYLKITISNGKEYSLKTIPLMKISEYVNNICSQEKFDNSPLEMPHMVDEKFMNFLIDYTDYVDKYNIPVFNEEKIIAATVLEAATNSKINELFVKNFNYRFMRSDLAVHQFLDLFGHMLECSAAIISNSLITIFAIAHKIIIQHLPSSEFIIDAT